MGLAKPFVSVILFLPFGVGGAGSGERWSEIVCESRLS